jgi:hypothetical protein
VNAYPTSGRHFVVNVISIAGGRPIPVRGGFAQEAVGRTESMWFVIGSTAGAIEVPASPCEVEIIVEGGGTMRGRARVDVGRLQAGDTSFAIHFVEEPRISYRQPRLVKR